MAMEKDELEALAKRLREAENSTLQAMLSAAPGEYLPEALALAKAELAGRKTGVRVQQTAAAANEGSAHWIDAEVYCLKQRTDVKTWNTAQERGMSATVHYNKAKVTLNRPARDKALVSIHCPVCNAQLKVTVWSRDRIISNRGKCIVGILVSLPFCAFLAGIFPLIICFSRLLGRHSRQGLFYGEDDGWFDKQGADTLLSCSHAVEPLKNS
jgi:hypothetical protein